jgi:hypothetical protein
MTIHLQCYLGKGAALRDVGPMAGSRPAIRVVAAWGAAPGGLWGIELTVAHRLPMTFVAAAASLPSAFALTIEELDGRARGALRLGAPGYEPGNPNFVGPPIDPAIASSSVESVFATSVWIVPEPAVAGRPLILRVILQPLVSDPVTLIAPASAT